MTTVEASRLSPAPDPGSAADLRALFQRHDFAGAVEALIGADPSPKRLAVLAQNLPDGPVSVLLSWFVLQLPVDDEMARRIGPGATEQLVATGLVLGSERGWVAKARLSSFQGLLVAGDPPSEGSDPGFVAPVSGTTATAAHLVSRRPARRGLDLCTGSGVLGILLARHVDHVVATDVAPRALGWAAFNAALNETSLDLRLGSFLDPVADERFDAVVANPPFVVGPGDGLTYRDAGLSGDAVSELVVRGIVGVLAPGGRAVTTLSWLGSDPGRPLGWCGDVTSTRLLRTAGRSPAAHAAAWVPEDRPVVDEIRELDRWREAVEAAGGDFVSEGVLLIDDGDGRRVRRCDDLTKLPDRWLGDRFDSLLDAGSAMPDDIGDTRLHLAPDASVVRADSTAAVTTRLRRLAGLLSDIELTGSLADVVGSLDGRQTTAAVITATALRRGADPRDREGRTALTEALLDLVGAGALEPVPRPGDSARTSSRGGAANMPAPPVASPAVLVVLREELARSGYDAPSVAARLGTTGGMLAHPDDLPLYDRRLGREGLDALVRLLLLGQEVAEGSVPDLLVETGLADCRDGLVQPLATVVPHGDLLVASDLYRLRETPDFVPGVQQPSRTLADLVPRSRVGRALDMGTGCGVQALLLARHADTVVATDVSSRALAFALFNAGLAGVRLDLREGPWFEPVQGERFDLVVANPPYVISPGARQVFRDAGLPRDRATELVCSQVPEQLAVGGVAVVLASWIAADGPPPPLAWSAEQSCDALLLATDEQDAWTTAGTWNRHLRGDSDRYSAALDSWSAWMQEEGITATAYGALVLQRRSVGSSARLLPLPGPPAGPAGHQVARMLAARALLEQVSLRDVVLAPVDDVDLVVTAGAAGHGPRTAELRQRGGLQLAAELDAQLLDVVAACDGRRTVAAARDVAGAHRDEVLPALEGLMLLGLLMGRLPDTPAP